jgi:hypothetical protein
MKLQYWLEILLTFKIKGANAMKKVVYLLVFCSLAFFVNSAYALEKDDRIMKKGARPMGMGGAFVAIADDENAAFYNPAGITQRKSSLLSILGFGAAINSQTIKLTSDVIDLFSDSNKSGSNGGMSIEDLKKAKNVISDKDIDMTITSPFLALFYLSKPIEIGSKNNTLSFGFGEFSSVDIGANIAVKIPSYVFDLAQIAEKDPSSITINDVVGVLPTDILEDFGSNLTPQELADLLQRIANGDTSAANTIYDSLDQNAKDLIDDLQNGNKSLEDVIQEIEQKFPTIQDKLLGSAGANGIVNTYGNFIIDAPIAYRFKSLEAINLPGELSVGMNLKYIYRIKVKKLIALTVDDVGAIEDSFDTLDLSGVSGSGFGLDLGTIYHFTPQWNFGLQIADLFTRINYNSVIFKYPKDADDERFLSSAYIAPQFNIGVAWTPSKIYMGKDKYVDSRNRLTLAADIRDIFGSYDKSFANKFHVGAEYRFSPFAIRLGLNKFRFSAGLGIETNAFQLSYAFYGDESYLSKALGDDKTVYYHEFIISLKFGHHRGRPFGNDLDTNSTQEVNK